MKQKLILLLLMAFSSLFIFSGCDVKVQEVSDDPAVNSIIDNGQNNNQTTGNKLSVKITKVTEGKSGDKILVPIRVENLENLETVSLTVDYDDSKVKPKTVVFESEDGKISYLDADLYSIETEVSESGKLGVKISKKASSRLATSENTGTLAYVLFEAIVDFSVSADEGSVLSISECEVNDEVIDLDPEETVLDVATLGVELQAELRIKNYGLLELSAIVDVAIYKEVEDDNSGACIELYSPVCGVNGKTYSNECLAGNAGVEIDYLGECQEESDELCINLYSPVCGIDGNTYTNECYAAKTGIEIAYEGECQPVIPPSTDTFLEIIPSKTQVAVGETFTTKVKINNVENLYKYDLKIEYDPSLVRKTNFKYEDFLMTDSGSYLHDEEIGINNTFNLSAYTICLKKTGTSYKLVPDCKKKVSGSGVLFEITWEAKSNGQANFKLVNSEILDASENRLDFYLEDSSVGIESNPVLTILPSSDQVQKGDIFTTQVKIDKIKDLGGFTVKVNFDQNSVVAEKVVFGEFLTSTGQNIIPLIDEKNQEEEIGGEQDYSGVLLDGSEDRNEYNIDVTKNSDGLIDFSVALLGLNGEPSPSSDSEQILFTIFWKAKNEKEKVDFIISETQFVVKGPKEIVVVSENSSIEISE